MKTQKIICLVVVSAFSLGVYPRECGAYHGKIIPKELGWTEQEPLNIGYKGKAQHRINIFFPDVSGFGSTLVYSGPGNDDVTKAHKFSKPSVPGKFILRGNFKDDKNGDGIDQDHKTKMYRPSPGITVAPRNNTNDPVTVTEKELAEIPEDELWDPDPQLGLFTPHGGSDVQVPFAVVPNISEAFDFEFKPWGTSSDPSKWSIRLKKFEFKFHIGIRKTPLDPTQTVLNDPNDVTTKSQALDVIADLQSILASWHAAGEPDNGPSYNKYYLPSAIEAHERKHLEEYRNAVNIVWTSIENYIESNLKIPISSASSIDKAEKKLKTEIQNIWASFIITTINPNFKKHGAGTEAGKEEAAAIEAFILELQNKLPTLP